MNKSQTSATIVEYIYNADQAFEEKRSKNFKKESEQNLILPLRVITLLIAISGLFAMIFEVRYFTQFALQVYLTRLSATLISFIILLILYSRHALKYPIALVHILLMTIIASSGYMILLLPSTLIVNSQIVGLMIFTSALFLSWELKHQIIVAIYYNIVFASAILLNDKAIYFLPNMYESVLFVIFLSVISVIGSSVNFKLRSELAEKTFRVKLSERKFRSIFEHSAEGIFQSSPEGKFLTVNSALVQMLGYSSEDEMKKVNIPEDIYLKPSDRDRLITVLQHKSEIINYRLPLRKKDNTQIIVRINERIVKEDVDTKIYFEGSVVDITEQANLEDEQVRIQEELKLEKMKSDKLAKEAVRSSEIKSQFLANMSHEIRTPINGILGFLTFIENGLYKDQDEFQDFISSARSSAESLLDLVNDILDFSKIEAGKMELDEIGFNISKLITDASSVIIPLVTEKNLKIDYVLDRHIPAVLLGDSIRMRQIFINLLSNAVKFTSVGGITIKVVSEKIGIDKVKLTCSVSDTGVGIPQEKITQLFKAFSQVDGSYTRKFGGTGLGLAISRELVNMMNGSIWVESEVGKGSTFSFTCVLKFERQASFLDKLKSRVAPEIPKPVITNASYAPDANVISLRSAKRILVAEDNPVNKKVVMKMLGDAGFVAEAVANGIEAVQAVTSNKSKYHLILMDVQMPEMDGFTATQQIRMLSPHTSKLPIIALTAHATSSDREKCLSAGMSDYLSKPIKTTELVGMIDRWLQIDYSSIPGARGKTKEKVSEKFEVISQVAKEISREQIIPVEVVAEAVPVVSEVFPEKPVRAESSKHAKVDVDEVFDVAHFKSVSLDDSEFKADLLLTYLDDTHRRLAQLSENIRTGNIAATISEGHTIKGASYSVGAKSMGDAAKELELAAKNNEADKLKDCFEKIKKSYKDLVSIKEELLKL